MHNNRLRYVGAACIGLMLSVSGCKNDDSGDLTLQNMASSHARAKANAYPGYKSESYAGLQHWLCHPGLSPSDNVCNADLDTTSVTADGTATVEPFKAAEDPAVDCFYVYPTTSIYPGVNSDFHPGPQENLTTIEQAARYSSICRMFVPVYRQHTLTALALTVLAGPLGEAAAPLLDTTGTLLAGKDAAKSDDQAYLDVLDAFREYMSHNNNGRGYILIGHSQGAFLLRRLIADEIENNPIALHRMISAQLIGGPVAVPIGADVGGSFQHTPACRSVGQIGCVINFSTYRKGDPELKNPTFGTTDSPDTQALCTNPAALGGGMGVLRPYLPFVEPPVFQLITIPRGSGGPYANPLSNLAVTTPYYTVPNQITAQCVVNEAGTSYLQVEMNGDPKDPRADDYPGEFIGGTGWGLHLIELPLTQGNLLDVATAQIQAWLSRQK